VAPALCDDESDVSGSRAGAVPVDPSAGTLSAVVRGLLRRRTLVLALALAAGARGLDGDRLRDARARDRRDLRRSARRVSAGAVRGRDGVPRRAVPAASRASPPDLLLPHDLRR